VSRSESYLTLDADRLTEAVRQLEARVSERFPGTGLASVADQLRATLSRYLDYCSEMLSLTGKIAALYVQTYDDGVALAAVNEVEGLTTGLSRKIWQKLMILETGVRHTPDEQAIDGI